MFHDVNSSLCRLVLETHPIVHLNRQMDGIMGILVDFSLTVKAATLIFISGRGSAISSTKEGKSGSIYNLVKSL